MPVVVLIGSPVAHSLSPRMQNAAFAERGLDWRYEGLDVRPEELDDVVGRLELGANVTAPYKRNIARIVGSELPSVNTLVVRDEGVKAFSTDAAILEGLQFERAAIIGDGGAAVAFRQAVPDARVFSRRGQWPPEVDDRDLVVNATPVRDEVFVRLGLG
jgi:shikimate dehydrogenase